MEALGGGSALRPGLAAASAPCFPPRPLCPLGSPHSSSLFTAPGTPRVPALCQALCSVKIKERVHALEGLQSSRQSLLSGIHATRGFLPAVSARAPRKMFLALSPQRCHSAKTPSAGSASWKKQPRVDKAIWVGVSCRLRERWPGGPRPEDAGLRGWQLASSLLCSRSCAPRRVRIRVCPEQEAQLPNSGRGVVWAGTSLPPRTS